MKLKKFEQYLMDHFDEFYLKEGAVYGFTWLDCGDYEDGKPTWFLLKKGDARIEGDIYPDNDLRSNSFKVFDKNYKYEFNEFGMEIPYVEFRTLRGAISFVKRQMGEQKYEICN